MVDKPNHETRIVLHLNENQRMAVVTGAGFIAGVLTKRLTTTITKAVGAGVLLIAILRFFKWIDVNEKKITQDLQNLHKTALEEANKLMSKKELPASLRQNAIRFGPFIAGTVIGYLFF